MALTFTLARNIHLALPRVREGNYTLNGLIGFEVRSGVALGDGVGLGGAGRGALHCYALCWGMECGGVGRGGVHCTGTLCAVLGWALLSWTTLGCCPVRF